MTKSYTHCDRKKSTLALISALTATLVAASTVSAQQARLRVLPEAIAPGQTVSYGVLAATRAAYALWIDVEPQASLLLGESLRIQLSPAAFSHSIGITDGNGVGVGQIAIPNLPSLVGASVFAQGFVLDATSPNGIFRSTDGESLTFHSAKSAHIERFDDPLSEGFSGEFEPTTDGRLIGLLAKKRSVVTVDKSKHARFGQALVGELSPFGAHQQVVLRATDLAAKGDEEIVVALRMRPFGNVSPGLITRMAIDLSHSLVVPDFTLDPFTSLPRFPASGLSPIFSRNITPQTSPRRVYLGPWAIQPSQVTPSGYLPYPPIVQTFRYNGRDSLLIDFRVAPTSTLSGQLGHQVWLPVPSSPLPNARIVTAGFAASTYDPFLAPINVASTTDNTLFEFEVDLVDATSIATSPWRDSGSATPIYQQPILAATIPAGTEIIVELREALDAMGRGAGPGTTNASTLTGMRLFQQRMTLRGRADGARPWLEALVVPID